MPPRELARLLDDHGQAQARISAGTSGRALAAWSRVSPTSLPSSAATWLAVVLAVLRQERTRSQEVAATFYRLHRALETGYTLPLMAGKAPEVVTLGELRNEWAEITETPRPAAPDDDATVQVDDFTWPTSDTTTQDAAARTSLMVTGPVRARREIDRLSERQERGRLDSADFLAELETVMQDSGTTSAAAVDRETLRGGRELIRDAAQADPRVLGWARVTDADPCHFCAMLAGRGAVYRSRKAAGTTRRTTRTNRPDIGPDDLQKFHDMCHCQTIPVYSRNAFMPESSAQYARDWTRITRGLAGAEARAAWRRHVDGQRRERRETTRENWRRQADQNARRTV